MNKATADKLKKQQDADFDFIRSHVVVVPVTVPDKQGETK